MSKNKRWVITTSGEQKLKKIKNEATKKGFKVDEIFDEIGVFNGTGDKETAEKLREIPGIVDVSPEDPPIEIGPPNTPITW